MRATVVLEGKSAETLLMQAEDYDMTAEEYMTLALNIVSQLPKMLVFSISAGVPVRFYASAYVGEEVVPDA